MANLTNNKKVLDFIAETKALCQPDNIVWIDGTEEQAEALRAEACSTGELIKLNQELLPNCSSQSFARSARLTGSCSHNMRQNRYSFSKIFGVSMFTPPF